MKFNIKNSLLILFIIILLFKIKSNNSFFIQENFEIKEPCSDSLSDIEYLKHMIPHHQVAIDISILLQKKTKWDIMHEILRKLIWTQSYEIEMMNRIIQNFPTLETNINNSCYYSKIKKLENNYNKYVPLQNDFIRPNKLELTKTYCDPHFFDPKGHMEHMKHMNLNDETYIEHMIPHHQVAIDMSKKLLKNTKNSFMIELAYRIIRSQQSEILLLKDLQKNNYKYKSNLIT